MIETELLKFAHPGLQSRFWPKVKFGDGCWEWNASRSPAGYGRITVRSMSGAPLYAHRLIYELYFGELESGLFVCHRCDNPPCVRPDHLFAGTCADNAHDMQSKGRGCKGEQHPDAVLTEADVIAIRERYAQGRYPLSAVARDYGISESHAHGIISGKFWSHVPGAIVPQDRPDNVMKGTEVYGAKLTDEKVRDILARLRGGQSRRDIAELFGVTPALIGMIDRNVIWKHIERVAQ